jgi:hypothetical protein
MKKDWKMGHWEGSHYIPKGNRGYHSKYGGGKRWKEPDDNEWYCQSCNQPQLGIMPSYSVRLNDEESVRVCPMCKHISLVKEIIYYTELVNIIRPFGNAIANLLSLPLRY